MPDELTAADRDALVERMRPVAEMLTTYVHTPDPAGVAHALAPLGILELRALTIVLAERRRPGADPDDDGIIDEIAVERVVVEGERIRLTTDEKRLAAQQLVQAGHGPAAIARILRVSGTVAHRLYEYARRHRPPDDQAA